MVSDQTYKPKLGQKYEWVPFSNQTDFDIKSECSLEK